MSGEERWSPVEGFPGYEVSDRGRVRSGPRILRPDRGNRGHLRVRLYGPDGRARMRWVHRLVLEAFAGPPLVRHLNDDPADNRLENLRWGCRRENARDAVANGRRPRGERHPRAKLDAAKVRWLREMHARGVSCADLARRLGVSKAAVSAAARGDTWGHVA